MANTVVLGMQWGDEGKGKIVDLICPAFDAVARFQGGHNAGHTVKFADRHFALHLLPSGILHPATSCVLGNGMVIAPQAFAEELAGVEAAGVETAGRLLISDRAQVILPPHAALDQARETSRGEHKIGTTVRGIGPAYETKASRMGLRTADLSADDLELRLEPLVAWFRAQLSALGATELPEVAALADQCRQWGEQLAPYLRDTANWLNRSISDGHNILFEGAQGALLDIDHGTFPFVTSSNATAGGVCTGTGVPPTRIDGVLGVVKAYTTRVGAGPFVGELNDSAGEHLRERGNEFGTTTGRPRRCGWFDAVAARASRQLNGVDTMALTKLDVLDELDEIQVCTGYRYRGETLHDFPSRLEVLNAAEPILETLPGWGERTVGILEYDQLPANAKAYISFLEQQVEAPVGLISTGPRREETLLVNEPNLERLLSGRTSQVLEARGTD